MDETNFQNIFCNEKTTNETSPSNRQLSNSNSHNLKTLLTQTKFCFACSKFSPILELLVLIIAVDAD